MFYPLGFHITPPPTYFHSFPAVIDLLPALDAFIYSKVIDFDTPSSFTYVFVIQREMNFFLEKSVWSFSFISLNSTCCNLYVNMLKRPKYHMEGWGNCLMWLNGGVHFIPSRVYSIGVDLIYFLNNMGRLWFRAIWW